MNRYKRCLSGASAALLIAAASAPCANVLFSDNFTDPAATIIDNWAKGAADESMTGTVNGGSFTVDNGASNYIGEYIHTFGANKPATFTLSYKLKSVTGDAGVLFCRQPGNSPFGYLLTAKGDSAIAIYKITTAGIISADPIFYQHSVDLNPTDNILVVSKSGSSFHVYANGEFQGSFSDNSYNSGDISLFLFNKTKAVFGELSVTDEFKPGSGRTSFSDDFNDNKIHKYWRQDIASGVVAPTVEEIGGKLRMKSGASSGAYIYVDINLTDFSASVEASHLSGGLSTSPYGFFLKGDNASSQMVKFFILGGGYYAMWKSGDPPYTSQPNGRIHGGKGHELNMILTDTLTLKKRDNSSNYEFIVNGEPLPFDLGTVNFSVKAIGLFCENDVEVAFDNFKVEQHYPVSIIRNSNNKQISRAKPPLTAGGRAFYDMRGRKRYSVATPTAGRIQTKAAGIYVNKNGRDVAVKKGKVTGE